MSFEKHYEDLLKYAKTCVFGFSLPLEPGDLVNDAYISLCDKEYDFGDFKNEIQRLAYLEKNSHSFLIDSVIKGSRPEFTGDTTCVCCKQTKHVSEFRIVAGIDGKRFLRTDCKACEVVKLKKRNYKLYRVLYNKSIYNKIKITTKYKKQNKDRFKKHVDENREAWNSYLRKRSKQASDQLTDAYIKKVLKPKLGVNVSLTDIENYRQKIIRKREKKLLALQ